MSYYPEADSNNRNKIKVEFNLSYYTTEFDLKRAQDIDTLEFDTISDLANLKSNVDN